MSLQVLALQNHLLNNGEMLLVLCLKSWGLSSSRFHSFLTIFGAQITFAEPVLLVVEKQTKHSFKKLAKQILIPLEISRAEMNASRQISCPSNITAEV